MKNPFQKPKRGPTPDGYALKEIERLTAANAILDQQLATARAALPELKDTAESASLAAIVDSTPANIKADAEAGTAYAETTARVAKLISAIQYARTQIEDHRNEAAITKHKRDLNTCHRQLDKRDGFALDVAEKATAFLKSIEEICIANDAAYSVKPTWPDTDNGFGLAPNSFRWKISHELWRIAEELDIKWPAAARETLISDRTLTLADRLKAETVDIMDRMRQRPVLGIAADPDDLVGSPQASSTPSAEAIVQPETLDNLPISHPEGQPLTGIRADQIPIRRETLKL